MSPEGMRRQAGPQSLPRLAYGETVAEAQE